MKVLLRKYHVTYLKEWHILYNVYVRDDIFDFEMCQMCQLLRFYDGCISG